MARASRLKAAKLRRIAESPHEITVVLRDTAPGPVGVPLAGALVNPLTGNRPTPTETAPALPGDTTAGRVGPLKCLWYDAVTLTHLWRFQKTQDSPGFDSRVEVWCEVAYSDIETVRATIFDDAAYVEYKGRRYVVMKSTPLGTGDIDPYTIIVWLRGQVGQ